MERFEHGGDVHAHPGALDFSASLNPLGMPETAVEALRESVPGFEAYPDPRCALLARAIAEREGVPAEWVLPTAGATDLATRVSIALRPRAALLVEPCYSGYEQALLQACPDSTVLRHELRAEEGFGLTGRVLADVARLADAGAAGLVVLASPNNPTGLTVAPDLVERVAEAAARGGAVLLLDECFHDFVGGPSGVGLCTAYPNLVVMKAFTKTYAMAGLRLGYGICSDAALLERLRAAGQPWAVSTPAQVAGLAALEDTTYVTRSRAYVAAERERLSRALASIGFSVVPGEANYLLFDAHVEGLYGELLERGVLVRRCENFPGLGPTWYRVAVRRREENDLLVAALRDVVGVPDAE